MGWVLVVFATINLIMCLRERCDGCWQKDWIWNLPEAKKWKWNGMKRYRHYRCGIHPKIHYVGDPIFRLNKQKQWVGRDGKPVELVTMTWAELKAQRDLDE